MGRERGRRLLVRFGTQESGGQPCDDHRSFQVDMCSVVGNCPDHRELPCGMYLSCIFLSCQDYQDLQLKADAFEIF